MSAQDIVTAYSVAVPEKQSQEMPGLDKKMTPHLEYTKLEIWDDEGKPSLVEYQGSGKLKGKTAIITGADSGIGRAAAIMFAREGCSGITITYLPEEEADAKDAKKIIEDSGAKCNITSADLMDEAACKKVVDDHLRAFGKLNILVNNASKQLFCKQFENIDLKNVESTFRSNILQMFALTKFALPHLNRGASIINTTSVTAYRGSGSLVDYSATKGAIMSFTRSLAVQLASKGIRVNAVAPGPIVTALQSGSRSAENMEGFGVGMPLHGRAGQPAEAGPSYVFLASSDSNILTGQVIHINSKSAFTCSFLRCVVDTAV
ncbi:NAD(P)-binding protein [Pholiota conissans]|uniref:NAD(P)-binding protein n=1 Tax=Pholiota conissans TaxID=109636 RepID=A0A9P6CT42_9AGAR|nr:NAD(P)-binding protein [Pholiota conissans]